MLNRNITNTVNWFLDNIIPPILRDWRLFMMLITKLAFGNKSNIILEFKEKLPFLTEEDISNYYDLIKDTQINTRPTDINKKTLNFIIDNIIGSIILDAGCGRGELVNKIAQNNSLKVIGVDIVQFDFLKLNVEFIKGSLAEIPLPDSSCDTVVCAHVLEHIIYPEKALKELLRVANKRLIIVVPQQREYKYTVDLHVNFFPYLYSFQRLIYPFINQSNHVKYLCLNSDFVCIIDKTNEPL
ncbi:MAG: class I SAM-dependent methyltransferase [Deferribacteraceae bacterium]|jgi:ubiquinone/menaquinone biosynthesis C-methylase UbiE|nr:class I SAM-dependent methyltransferase [Deferribacteraceae bacterium]